MAIADDISVAINGDVRYTGTTANYTVIEFHRFLQDLADDAVSSGDDLLDITDETPTERSTDNIITLNAPYNIDDTLAQHLYDGSITQAGGDTIYSGLVVVGSVPAGTQLQIVQDNTLLTNYWTTGLNVDAANNILLRIMVKTRDSGADIDGKRLRIQARELGDTYAEFSLTAGLGNSTAAIFTSTDLNNATIAGTISGWTSIVNTEGYQLIDVTGDGSTEPYYSQWDLGTQSINDLYERTKWIQRRATSETIHSMNGEYFRGITHDITYDNEASGPFTEDEVVVWGTSFAYDTETGASSWTVGEYLSIGSAVGKLLQVTDSGVTGSMIVAVEGGATISDGDAIAQLDGGDMTAAVNGAATGNGVAGGEGHLLALDDDGLTGRVFIQLLTGSAPVDNLEITGRTSGATADVNVTITSRTISPEFIGTSTGSAIIGAYGIGLDINDLTSSDQLFDLDNTLRVPPNNVTFTVNGLVSGEDRVLVGPESGGVLQVDQFGIKAASGLTTANITSVAIDASIPSDTPATGTIRVFDNNGVSRRLEYTSWTGDTFTIDPTASEAEVPNVADFDTVNADAANNVFISYIDKLADATTATFTSVYSSSRALFIRVRDGGASPIKTFETTGTLGSSGGSATAIRTSDA